MCADEYGALTGEKGIETSPAQNQRVKDRVDEMAKDMLDISLNARTVIRQLCLSAYRSGL